jgi:acyl-CoA hydrolase
MESEIIQQRVVFPAHLNDNNTLFGGIAMQWMDEVAYIIALKYTRKNLVTVSVEKVKFLLPIELGSLLTICGKVSKVTRVTLDISVDIFAEDKLIGNKVKAISGIFTFAAIDDHKKPIRLDK